MQMVRPRGKRQSGAVLPLLNQVAVTAAVLSAETAGDHQRLRTGLFIQPAANGADQRCVFHRLAAGMTSHADCDDIGLRRHAGRLALRRVAVAGRDTGTSSAVAHRVKFVDPRTHASQLGRQVRLRKHGSDRTPLE